MVSVEKKHTVEAHEPHWPSVWIWLGFVVVFTVAELALGWSLFQGHVWLACALVLLIAHLMHAHILAFHEAGHGTLCPSRFWNEAIGMLIGSLSFQGLTIFRVVHQTHHAYLGTERDEELWPFVVPGTARWVRCLIAIYELTLGITYTPILCFRTLLRAESPVKDPLERRRIWAEYGLVACVWFVNLSLIGKYHVWNYFVCMYVVPGLIAGNMHSIRKYIEHMGLMGSTILSSTRSVVPTSLLGRVAAFSLFNIQFHGVHHRYARIPQGRLPKFVPLLEPTEPSELAPYRSYREAMCDMLRSLGNPRVGAQWLSQLAVTEVRGKRALFHTRIVPAAPLHASAFD